MCRFQEFGDDVNLTDVQVFGAEFKQIFLLSELSINYLPIIIKNIQFMEILEIKSCSGEMEFYPGLFENLTNLSTLDIQDVSIKTIGPNSFKGASELKILQVNKCGVQEISDQAFNGLPNLEKLYLQTNEIKKLYPRTFQDLQSLRELSLAENQIQSLKEGLFENNKELQFVSFMTNSIKSIFPFLFDHLKQFYLDLSDNYCVNRKFDHDHLDIIYEGIEDCVENDDLGVNWREKYDFIRTYYRLKKSSLRMFRVIILIGAFNIVLIAVVLAIIVKIRSSRRSLHRQQSEDSDDSILNENFLNRSNSQTRALLVDIE